MACTPSAADPLCPATAQNSVSGKELSLIQVKRDQLVKGFDAGALAVDSRNHENKSSGDHHKHRNHHKPWRWMDADIRDLHDQEAKIFTYGSQKTQTRMGGDHFAAAHLWSSFLLDKSDDMTDKKLTYLFGGFCAVSANPIEPADDMRYRLTLDQVGGGTRRGYTYYCCWPCMCDMKEFVKVDTKTVTLKNGKHHKYHFLVYGNPCGHPEKLSKHFDDPFAGTTTLKKTAPAVHCKNGKLEGATLSDHGHIIMSMFFDDDQSLTAYDETEYKDRCEERARQDYNSGPGKIFRQLAGINRI